MPTTQTGTSCHGLLVGYDTLIEGAIFREWVTNVGRREGTSRMAHVLCELIVRLKAVGLVEDHVCDLPIRFSISGA
jgi:hypothetical protein